MQWKVLAADEAVVIELLIAEKSAGAVHAPSDGLRLGGSVQAIALESTNERLVSIREADAQRRPEGGAFSEECGTVYELTHLRST